MIKEKINIFSNPSVKLSINMLDFAKVPSNRPKKC